MNQSFGESDEITCEMCFKMKGHLGVLINELKSAKLIIKILQEEIKSSSTGTRNQDNPSSCVECNSNRNYHTAVGKGSVWKKIKRHKHSAIQPKNTLNCARHQNSYILLIKNRFEPISNYQPQDHPHNCVQTELNGCNDLGIMNKTSIELFFWVIVKCGVVLKNYQIY